MTICKANLSSSGYPFLVAFFAKGDGVADVFHCHLMFHFVVICFACKRYINCSFLVSFDPMYHEFIMVSVAQWLAVVSSSHGLAICD